MPKSKANKEDVQKIQKLYDDGLLPDQIVEQTKDALNIYPKAILRVIESYKVSKVKEKAAEATEKLEKVNTFHKIEGEEIEEIATPPSEPVDMDGWSSVAEDAIDVVMEYNVSEEKAVQLVQEAMDKVDLTKEPDVEAITSHVFSNASELLSRHDNQGQTVVSMTGAASLAGANTIKKPTGSKYEDSIFRPNPAKRAPRR